MTAPQQQIVRTLKEVAAAFQVRYDTVKKEWRANGMPGKPGAYNLDEIAAWKKLRLREPTADDDPVELQRRKRLAECRVKEAQAERLELANRIAREGLLRREDVHREWSEHIIAAKNILERAARKMMPHFPAKNRTRLAGELDQILFAALECLAAWSFDRPTEEPAAE